jgi:hypothetical protein
MVIVKRGSQYILYSRNKRKILGKFRSRKAALKHERQIMFFKSLQK